MAAELLVGVPNAVNTMPNTTVAIRSPLVPFRRELLIEPFYTQIDANCYQALILQSENVYVGPES